LSQTKAILVLRLREHTFAPFTLLQWRGCVSKRLMNTSSSYLTGALRSTRRFSQHAAVLSLLLFVGAASLQGQSPVVCQAMSAVPPIVRSMGTAELVGDFGLSCTGGTAGQQRTLSLSLFLNTTLTSRTYASGTQSEAVLVVQDQSGGVTHFTPGVPSGNSVVWNGVNITEPGANGSIILRITNLRADASAVPAVGGLIPTQILAFLSANGGVALDTPQQVLALVLPEMQFSVRDCAGISKLGGGGAATSCAGSNNAGATSNLMTGSAGTMQYSVTFEERHGIAFRKQVASVNAPPGVAIVSESGYIPTLMYNIGLANQGTRLHARFTNVPAGVRLFVTNRQSSGTTAGSTAALVQVNGTYVPDQLAPRVPQPPLATHTLLCPTTGAEIGAVEVPITNGSGEAVWEVTESSPTATEQFAFGVAVAHAGVPTFSEATVEGFLGPVFSEVTPAISNPPIPRFRPVVINRQVAGAFSPVSLSPKVLPAGRTTLVTIRASDGSCVTTLSSVALQPGLTAAPVTPVNGTTWTVPITVEANTPEGATPVGVISNAGVSTVTLTVGQPVFTISGRVTKQGVGFTGARVTLGGGPGGTQFVDASGNYAFPNLPPGSYTVTPSMFNYAFDPQQGAVANLQADTTLDFVATSTVLPIPPCCTSIGEGATVGSTTQNLSWSGGDFADSWDVYFGTNATPPFYANVVSPHLQTPVLAVGTTYYWRVVGKNQAGSASSLTWSFHVAQPPGPPGLRFYIVTPCRAMDTRGLAGASAFGGPALASYETRAVAVHSSGCGAPPWAQAYSLNVTAVPAGGLNFLSTWPAGQAFPNVSTLNSPAGVITANAAIVPTGTNGAVNVLASNPSDVILDVNGYFTSVPEFGELLYHPVTPCRAVDTRASQGKSGAFGPPALTAFVNRDFPIPSSGCNIPALARAYAMNMTVVPSGRLDYVSMWPSGQSYPGVSTLNAPDGGVVANAAIVPAGANGAVTVFGSANTELVMDVNGFFAPQSALSGGLYFHPVTPCRAVDTRPGQSTSGFFGPPALASDVPRDFPLRQRCNIPSTAQAYSLNITAVPHGALPYLSAWPTGQAFPNVSTLNSPNGRNIANAAIIPAGTDGSIRVMAAGPTDLIIDINGYFAP
jgi:hypothetical protein